MCPMLSNIHSKLRYKIYILKVTCIHGKVALFKAALNRHLTDVVFSDANFQGSYIKVMSLKRYHGVPAIHFKVFLYEETFKLVSDMLGYKRMGTCQQE